LLAQERFTANIGLSQPDPKLSVAGMGSGGLVAGSQTDFEHHDFISSRFQLAMKTKKTVGSAVRNFRRSFYGAGHVWERYPYRRQGKILSPERSKTLLGQPPEPKEIRG